MKAIRFTGVVAISIVLGLNLSCLRDNGNLRKNPSNSIQGIDLLSSPEDELTALSMVASDVTYIPLSTNEESMFSSIQKIRVNNGRLFLKVMPVDIMCFDGDGHFLFKLDMKGRGPREYQYIIDFDISDDGKTLALLSGKKSNYIQFQVLDSDIQTQ